MVKRFVIITVSILIVLCLTGCSKAGRQASTVIDSKIAYPNMTVYEDRDDRFYYAVDESTGVVYLIYISNEGYYNSTGGITVAYNSDGTVMTKEQLEE